MEYEIEEVPKRKGWKLRAIKLVFVFSLLGCLGFGGWIAFEDYDERFSSKIQEIRAQVLDQLTVIRVVEKYVAVQPEQEDVDILLRRGAEEFGVPPLLVKAMALQESGFNPRRSKEEPHLLKSGRVKPPKHLNHIEKLAWSSSHGLLQVIYGLHYKMCGLEHYSELFQPSVGIRCGLMVLQKCLQRHEGRSKRERLRKALECYNGAEVYADRIEQNMLKLISEEIL